MLKLLIDPSPCPANLPPCKTLKLKKDGWIAGPKEELILWLPLGLRNSLHFSDFDVINQFDYKGFKCGAEWMQCRKVIEP